MYEYHSSIFVFGISQALNMFGVPKINVPGGRDLSGNHLNPGLVCPCKLYIINTYYK